MELTNFTSFRNDFISDTETIDTLVLQTTPLDYPMTLQFKTLKDFFSYLSAVHILEPVFSGLVNTFVKASEIIGNYSMTYTEFQIMTTVNDKISIRFSPVALTNSYALAFSDTGRFGERNVFQPLGINDIDTLDSKFTYSLKEVSDFFDLNFKNKFFKGTITFSSSTFYTKGEIIYISDRDFYIIITSFKNEKIGTYAYSGVLTVKGS